MDRVRRSKVSPAMVVACVALAVALSGTSYAAFKLPKASVGTVHLKKNAVTSAKVKNRTLLATDFAGGQIPAGPPGTAGPKGDRGDKGDAGTQGPPGLSAYEVVAASKTVANAFFNTVQVLCPAGKRPLGGGSANNANAAEGPFVVVSRPSLDGNGWEVTTARSPAGSWTMNTYVVCATVAP